MLAKERGGSGLEIVRRQLFLVCVCVFSSLLLVLFSAHFRDSFLEHEMGDNKQDLIRGSRRRL